MLQYTGFFHLVPEMVKGYALARGRRLCQAYQERTKVQEALERLQGRPHADHEVPAAQAWVEAKHAEVTRWEAGHPTSRCHRDPFLGAACFSWQGKERLMRSINSSCQRS